MSIAFQNVSFPPLRDFTASAPDGAIIGIIGEKGSGKAALLRLATWLDAPVSGTVDGGITRRLIRLGEPLNFSPVDVLSIDAALSCQDALVRERACVSLERLRQAGCTILFATPDETLLRRLADEIWWLRDGALAAKGDVRDVLPKYHDHVAERLAEWGKSLSEPLNLASRRGDGRAEILSLETLDDTDQHAAVWKSGAPGAIRVTLRFGAPVENPVIGIMIRTRVGFEVYGTNTELERVPIGPCQAGQTERITFRFRCDLCPGDYTVTVASHDPDGTPHDWLDDAILFSVVDSRYTAGVANLRATVERG